jgi:hypothetical protein
MFSVLIQALSLYLVKGSIGTLVDQAPIEGSVEAMEMLCEP